MRSSVIVQTAARILGPLLLFFSGYLLVAGHNEPGGGFVGGLVATAALVLHAIASGVPAARRALRVDPRSLAGIGLVVALVAVWVGPLAGRPPMTGIWTEAPGATALELGTPVLFDAGVYLVVFGSAVSTIFSLSEETS
ncbi:MAG TPA: Na+/H+ antiporter subunit B [Anaeromyxobacteraceae bacterium]|nr:Na+/H+ antiporter subunit B [Anaeromyxobacteraceae bacterium]